MVLNRLKMLFVVLNFRFIFKIQKDVQSIYINKLDKTFNSLLLGSIMLTKSFQEKCFKTDILFGFNLLN